MKWLEILRNKNYALLQNETDTQYCVASGYDPMQPENNQWNHGSYFTYKNNMQKVNSLANALELFRSRTEENYISRCRLEKLATQFKDELYETDFDEEDLEEIFNEECDMTGYEKEFFGIEC